MCNNKKNQINSGMQFASTISPNDSFDSASFEKVYHYDGPLGAFVHKNGTSFLLWAPTAEQVVLKLYHKGDGQEVPRVESLQRGDRGVWVYDTSENLDGCYYRYEVTVGGVTRSTADPYARACGVNGHRSMVLDLSRTNPEGWELDQAPEAPAENIIYEIHVKDFTWDKSSGVSEKNRGKYLGLVESGTTLNGDGLHPTGLSYMKELGVTHVQLMPVYDYGSVDEAGDDTQFNWGYDPVNYNVPEGSYSSDPYHGEVRIRELKEVIQTLHKNGFRVIMDVVYNHTYSLDSFLNRTVPGYYYRFSADGKASNGSGCGNDIASERSMCGKYILDSVLYWIHEYHMDGFRFDLMGLLPVSLMEQIRSTVDAEFGPGRILLYGEPWRADQTAIRPGTLLADKIGLAQIQTEIGAFCDSTRDAIKGSLMQENAKGFANGGTYDSLLHSGCLSGWAGVKAEYSVRRPSQTINYLSCHDDWTLWDRLVSSLDPEKDFGGQKEMVICANRLAIALLFGCQGNLFLLSGEEAGRTKEGIKNSFNSSIWINRVNWKRMWEMEDLMHYYQGLFALRKQLPCLRNKSEHAREAITLIALQKKDCPVVEYRNPIGSCRWETICMIYNMKEEEQEVLLRTGKWQVLADGTDSFLWKETHYVEKQALLAGCSALVLGQESENYF